VAQGERKAALAAVVTLVRGDVDRIHPADTPEPEKEKRSAGGDQN